MGDRRASRAALAVVACAATAATTAATVAYVVPNTLNVRSDTVAGTSKIATAPHQDRASRRPRPVPAVDLHESAQGRLAPRKRCTVSAKLVPSCGAWWGVAPGAFTSTPPTQSLHEFERRIGRTVDIYHAYHRDKQIFPTAEEIAIAREPGKRRMLLLNWKPDIGRSWASVAAGSMDAHIDRLAAHINARFPEKFFLTIHHEPEEEVRPAAGSGYTATDYRNMFRHVAKRFRARGVDNALFTAVFMGAPKWGVKPWFDQLYPGNDVIDWLGMDPYASPDIRDFAHMVNQSSRQERGFPGFYNWSAKIARGKPLMIAEWGAFSTPAHQAAFFKSVGTQLKRYPRIKALVYFETPNGPFAGRSIDTRVDSSRSALYAYRSLSHHPLLTH